MQSHLRPEVLKHLRCLHNRVRLSGAHFMSYASSFTNFIPYLCAQDSSALLPPFLNHEQVMCLSNVPSGQPALDECTESHEACNILQGDKSSIRPASINDSSLLNQSCKPLHL